jgi:hypothetical protein
MADHDLAFRWTDGMGLKGEWPVRGGGSDWGKQPSQATDAIRASEMQRVRRPWSLDRFPLRLWLSDALVIGSS